MRDCNSCVFGQRDGDCASWSCNYISRKEAVEAWKKLKAEEERKTEQTEREGE